MGSQMSRCGDLQCSLSEQSKVPVEGISRRAHRVSNSSRKSRTTSWPTATRLCTALLYCVCYVVQQLGLVASHYVVVVQCCYIVRSLVCRGVTSTSKNSLLSLGSENLLAIDYTGFICFFIVSLSLSVYQIIIMKNVYRIFQFGVTGHLQILSDSNRIPGSI